ncbi:hypothetical protein [Coleofasciculus sp.]|uniref:hypothetical protein n=1 Tax=Coleofasciculus sp. TaxID=3100458 RepID=UPI0039FB0D62
MSPTNIESRLCALASEIALIQQEEVAEPNTWIERFDVSKSNGKRYVYFRLMEGTTKRSRSGKIQGKFKRYLGSASSAKYKAAKAAIDRRNQLRYLQKQYQRLVAAGEPVSQKRTGCQPQSVSVGSGGLNEKSKPSLTYGQNQLAVLQQKLIAVIRQYEAMMKVFQQQQQMWEVLMRDIEGLFGMALS